MLELPGAYFWGWLDARWFCALAPLTFHLRCAKAAFTLTIRLRPGLQPERVGLHHFGYGAGPVSTGLISMQHVKPFKFVHVLVVKC